MPPPRSNRRWHRRRPSRVPHDGGGTVERLHLGIGLAESELDLELGETGGEPALQLGDIGVWVSGAQRESARGYPGAPPHRANGGRVRRAPCRTGRGGRCRWRRPLWSSSPVGEQLPDGGSLHGIEADQVGAGFSIPARMSAWVSPVTAGASTPSPQPVTPSSDMILTQNVVGVVDGAARHVDWCRQADPHRDRFEGIYVHFDEPTKSRK